MEEKKEKKEKKKLRRGPVAKKDFVICQNGTFIKIKEGQLLFEEELKDFWENLKTEKVI